MTRTKRAICLAVMMVTLASCDMTPEEAIAVLFQGREAEAHSVMDCESGGDPNAVSPGGGNHGLFQINSVHRQRFADVWDQRYDPWWNTYMAKTIYNDSGWRPWSCRP